MPWTDTSTLGDIGRALRQRRAQGTAPHVVAIQEGFHVDIINLINEAGYPYRKDGPGATFSRAGSGLIILSEFPIVGSASHVYDHANSEGFDWDANKGVQYVQIRLPGMPQYFELLNTHLQADYNDAFDPLYLTQAARRRQIVEMADFFWRVNSRSGPLAFVGDFNTNTTLGEYYNILGRTFLFDAAETCSFWGTCRINTDLRREISDGLDHHFYRSGDRVTMAAASYERTFTQPVGGRKLSDHDGIEVEYALRW